MKRIVHPKTWSQLNNIEHPPLMLKQLFQGVCGGLRWLETKKLAEYIASRSIKEGFVSHHRRRRQPKIDSPSKAINKDIELSSDSMSAALSVYGALALPPKKRRLVSFDVLDCTFGNGFHSGVILENGSPYTRVVAIDSDLKTKEYAKNLIATFGKDRLRFFGNRMSEIKSLFGERSFDAVMIDPGPSFSQLEDPERGFLIDDENCHDFDMRYAPQYGLGCLQYLNVVPQNSLCNALISYSLLTPQQSMKMARVIRKCRPFNSSKEVIESVIENGYEFPEDGWMTQTSRRKSSMSWNFLTTLRCIVNNEKYELSEAFLQALLLLRKNGRVVVFTRLKWEESLLERLIKEHPHAQEVYREEIAINDVQRHGHTRHTKMWVVARTSESAYLLKNAVHLTNEQVADSSTRWMTGMYAGQTHGFPAHNFTFEGKDIRERRVERQNRQPPLFDYDE